MLSLTIAVLAFHALCLAGLAVMAKRDAVLVDENGNRLARNGAWRVHRVPASQTMEEAHIKF
ncbi:MAG: hypothetical protein ACK46X_08000 [Candidatus Sericytochromatia bacterium]